MHVLGTPPAFVLLVFCTGSSLHAQVIDTVAVEAFETDTSSVVDEAYETDEEEAILQPDTLVSSTVIFYNRDSLRRLKDDKNLKWWNNGEPRFCLISF